MIHYISEWGHMYLLHFGAWIGFGIGAHVMKNGLPETKTIPNILFSSAILGSVVALFSSYSHAHYLSHFLNK